MIDESLRLKISDTACALSERICTLLQSQFADDSNVEFYCLLRADDLAMMGMISEWTVVLRDRTTREHSHTSLNRCLAPEVLYPMFQAAFKEFGLRLDHPIAFAFSGDVPRSPDEPWRDFSPGVQVRVTLTSPVFVRPVGDLIESCWLDAELRVDKSKDGKDLIGCNIDPFSAPAAGRPRRGPECGNRWEAFKTESSNPSTFYVFLSHQGKHSYIPVARLTGRDPADGALIFQLDSRVEVLVHEFDELRRVHN